MEGMLNVPGESFVDREVTHPSWRLLHACCFYKNISCPNCSVNSTQLVKVALLDLNCFNNIL